jgi:oligopeptide transport system substrate-binding protein
MIKSLSLAVVALVLIGVLSSPAHAARKAAFRFINRGEVNTLDPNRMSWMQDIRIGYALWEGLYQLEPATLEPIPGAAEKIDISPDGLTYTFHLRKDGKWSNGDPVTSADFTFAWKRMLELPGDYTYLFYYIKGAKAYETAFASDAKTADFKTVGIEAPDASTLIVKLEHPVPYLPDVLAFPPFFPLNQKSMEPFKEIDAKTGRADYRGDFTRPPNLVTNGPFKLVSWELKVGQRMEPNPYYWDAKNVKLKGAIEAVSVDDARLAFEKYEKGEVDWLAEPTSDIAAEMRNAGRKDLKVFPSFGTYFYSLNCLPKLSGDRPNPLADKRVRQALAMAIDKQPIVDNITRLGEPITNQYVPAASFPTYKAPAGLKYDVAKARALLSEAGYPEGKGFPRLKIAFNTEYPEHKAIGEYVRKQWEDKLGITVELEGLEIKQFSQRLHNKDYDIARASWFGDYADISTFTDKYLSTSLNNDAAFVNARYDDLLKQATFELDKQKRLDVLAQAEALLLDEAPIIPLYHYVNKFAFHDNVQGISLNPRNMVMFKSITVAK